MNGADDNVDRQQAQKRTKPPGMIHVKKIKGVEYFKANVPVLMKIGFSALVLGNEGADDGSRRKGQQNRYGQFDGGEEIPDFLRNALWV